MRPLTWTDGVATVLRTLSGQFHYRYRVARAGGKDHFQASHAAKIARPLDIFLYRFGSEDAHFGSSASATATPRARTSPVI